jgi:hypothetical protein
MSKQLRLVLLDAGVTATATLLESDAPRTCQAIWEALPFEGELNHGIWSGPETYLLIDPSIRVPAENQTVQTQAGEIGYYTQEGGTIVDWPDDISELAFFYGRGARPGMPTGPVAVNLFAKVTDNLEEFARACDGIRRSGVTRLRVERLS